MTEKQKKVIAQLDKITEPKEKHIKDLESICQDGKHRVTADFLEMYRKEMLEYKELKILILEAFTEQDTEPYDLRQ